MDMVDRVFVFLVMIINRRIEQQSLPLNSVQQRLCGLIAIRLSTIPIALYFRISN